MKRREDALRELVHSWLKKSQDDLDVAELLLGQRSHLLDAIGFHAQQAAEKCMKALLVRHQVEFPKTHNLGEILDLVARVNPDLARSLRSATALNPYGVETRYPGDLPDMTREDAEHAASLASEVRQSVLRSLDAYLSGRED